MIHGTFTAGALALPALFFALSAQEPHRTDAVWPSFRGLHARGIAEGYPLPTDWSVEEGRGIAWRTPIRGLGHSSPVVWGDRIFLTTAVSGKDKPELRVGLYGDIQPVEDSSVHRFIVLCVSRKDGRVLWERTAHEGVPRVKRHTKGTHANSTVATDGRRVLAFFGSEGLYCYDIEGRLLWKKDFGLLDSGFFMAPSAQWGFASSPVIYKDRVLIQCDVQKDSFVAALRLKDGSVLWQNPRAEVPTWSTPTVFEEGGRAIMVVNGWKHIGAYDVNTGEEIWRMTGGGDIPVPTPVVSSGLIFITNAHGRMAPIYAIKTGAKGDITLADGVTSNSHVAWSYHREGAYMQTPLVYGDYLYVCRDNGVLSCYEAKTGNRVYQERLGTGRTGFTASGVAGDGKLYYTSEEGEVFVVKAGPQFQVLAQNPLGEVCMATPAISEGALYFRTQGHLTAIKAPAGR